MGISLSQVCQQMVPDSRRSCTECCRVGPRPTDEKRTGLSWAQFSTRASVTTQRSSAK